MRRVFVELARVMRPDGLVAFEVGEVRGGKVLLERHVINAISGLPFSVSGVMVNQQSFTKTANCWGVDNNQRGIPTPTGSCSLADCRRYVACFAASRAAFFAALQALISSTVIYP